MFQKISPNLFVLHFSGAKVTGYAFTLGSKKRLDLNIGKNECEAIQKIGKILEIRILEGSKLSVTVLSAVIGTG